MSTTAGSAATSGADLPRRRVLAGRYRLYEEIGAGGMSTVYRGHDLLLGRAVAVKIARVDDPMFRRCLREEARAFGQLNHSRIAQVYDFAEFGDAGGCYIVMEFVDGQPLSNSVTSGALP